MLNSNQLKNYKKEDKTMDASRVNNIIMVWTLILVLAIGVPYWFIWGISDFEITSILIVFVVYILFIFLHELLHLFGYIFIGKAKTTQVKLGIIWKYLMPYAHCKIPMKITHYKISILLPFILGIVPLMFAFLYGNGFWFVIGFLMSTGSLGDFLILWMLKGYPKETLVQDHPSKIGCYVYVLEANQLSNEKQNS